MFVAYRFFNLSVQRPISLGIARNSPLGRGTTRRCACSCPNSSEEHLPPAISISNPLIVPLMVMRGTLSLYERDLN